VQEVCRRAQEEGVCLKHGMEPMPRWTPLSEGWVRINTDAAYCHDSGSASAGIIARDVDGKVLLSAWKLIRNCGSPKQSEAEACLEGLRLAAEWICQPIWVESDCASLIQALGRTTDARSSIFGILSEIQAVKNILPDCKFSHIRRHLNIVAHNLAHESFLKKQSLVMRYDVPQCVRELV
jgi:ribonuclease HI